MKKPIIFIVSTLFLFVIVVQTVNAQLVDPKFIDGNYILEVANVYFEIKTKNGARFSSLKINGTEIMFIGDSPGNWGSSFWPSPQSEWGWPPSNELDEDPYVGGIVEKKIWLTSDTDEVTNLSFSKTAYGDLADTSINIDYVMINQKNEDQIFAPWEVTRVPSGGLAFFPAGDNDISGDMAESTEIIGSNAWYNNANSSGSKFFSDSKGWLAHVDMNRNLFIKVFDDISLEMAAPGEAEVEVYSGGNYVELENQGDYAPIAANDSIIWKVKWLVRQLPNNIDVNVGSESLIDYTISVINNTAPNSIKKNYAIDLSLYPNPTSNNIYLTNLKLNGHFYRIYNISGQIIANGNIEHQFIDVINLNKGFYIIKIEDTHIQYIGTFVKQ